MTRWEPALRHWWLSTGRPSRRFLPRTGLDTSPIVLPVEHQSEPIRAWKRADLVVAFDEPRYPMRFRGLGMNQRYRTEQKAVCAQEADHDPPELSCHCGFYAYRDMDRETAYSGVFNGVAVLEVELAGRVLQFENMWVAEWQRVLSVAINPQCDGCGDEASGLVHPVDKVVGQKVADLRPACCATCRLYPSTEVVGSRWLTLDDLRAGFGTEVGWAPFDPARWSVRLVENLRAGWELQTEGTDPMLVVGVELHCRPVKVADFGGVIQYVPGSLGATVHFRGGQSWETDGRRSVLCRRSS